MSSEFSKPFLNHRHTTTLEDQVQNEPEQAGYTARQSNLSSNVAITDHRLKLVPKVTVSNIVGLQRTLGNQAVQRLIQRQKAAVLTTRPAPVALIQRDDEMDRLSALKEGPAATAVKSPEEQLEEDSLVAHLSRPVGPEQAAEAGEPVTPEGRQTSAFESGKNGTKNLAGSFNSGLGVAVSAEKLGAPALESTAVLMGGKNAMKDFGKDLGHQAREGIRDNVTRPATGLVRGAMPDTGGGSPSSEGAAGLFTTAWRWLKDNGGKAVDWLTEHISQFFTDYLEPVMIAVGLDFVLLMKTVNDLRTRLKLRGELTEQKKALDTAPDDTAYTKAVQHSYGKVRRSVITGFVSVINSIIGIVGRLITIFSGGVAAIVGESLTILKGVISMAQKAFRTVKGIYKYAKGTKGKARATSARSFLMEAAGGSLPSAKVLQSMDLWGKVQQAKGVKGANTREGNVILKEMSEQSKDVSGPGKIITILETKYTPANDKVKKVVDEKVADNLKSS